MDHRWDEATWQDRASRAERERFSASRVGRDPDVERRDRLREAERRRMVNQGSWAIGQAYYDQRDLYTRNASIEDEGYGRGPSLHPEEGSYAYPRPLSTAPRSLVGRGDGHPSLHEREAWPWLNYPASADDPYFAHIHRDPPQRPLWQRLKERFTGKGPRTHARADSLIAEDVSDALAYRGDLDASDIEVTVQEGEVTLAGTVADRRSKRIAEEVCEGVRGVRDVHNRLKVRPQDPTDANVAFVLPLALGAL